MALESGNNDLDAFLATHRSILANASITPGELFGDWRVTAFLGRGGSGEVYRVVHITLGTAAALKVCVRRADRDCARDEAVCARFRHEAELLAKNKHPAFPRFFGFGERDGRPWYVMELLEHRPLPAKEKEIVQFLLAVASGVRHLHAQGIIHRDIKPGNILWRIGRVDSPQPAASTQPVLIDLGLAKDLSAVRGHAGETLSIVDGQAVGVGTPRYAAPEQMTGDDVSPATDVYALGMLANDCFGGNPPRAWRRIIQRATAAVPTHRYATTEAFARAVELVMIWRQSVRWIGGILFGAILVGLGVFTFRPSLPPNLNLEGKKVIIRKPIVLDGGKTYCVTGPGTLDADISGSTGTILKLKNCVLLNRTKNLYPKNGVHYKLEKSAYLNFIDVRKRPVEFDWAGAFDIGNDFNNKIYFGGPETLKEVHDLEGQKNLEFLKSYMHL